MSEKGFKSFVFSVFWIGTDSHPLLHLQCVVVPHTCTQKSGGGMGERMDEDTDDGTREKRVSAAQSVGKCFSRKCV